MNTNNVNKTTMNLEDSNGTFKTGETYRATILRVHETAVNVKMPGDKGSERPEVAPCRHGLLGVADGCIQRGDVRRGLSLLGRVARKLPKVYRDMAEVFDADGALSDARMAARYDRLADRREKALHQRARRNRRQHVERRRAGEGNWSRAT